MVPRLVGAVSPLVARHTRRRAEHCVAQNGWESSGTYRYVQSNTRQVEDKIITTKCPNIPCGIYINTLDILLINQLYFGIIHSRSPCIILHTYMLFLSKYR